MLSCPSTLLGLSDSRSGRHVDMPIEVMHCLEGNGDEVALDPRLVIFAEPPLNQPTLNPEMVADLDEHPSGDSDTRALMGAGGSINLHEPEVQSHSTGDFDEPFGASGRRKNDRQEKRED